MVDEKVDQLEYLLVDELDVLMDVGLEMLLVLLLAFLLVDEMDDV